MLRLSSALSCALLDQRSRTLIQISTASSAVYTDLRTSVIVITSLLMVKISLVRSRMDVPGLIRETEFCFSIKYPELHGRDAEEPWVMRQLLVHQRCDFQSKSSTWIFLQCPLHLQRTLADAGSRVALSEDPKPLELHMIILNYTLKNWRDYINHLETVIEDLVGQAYMQILPLEIYPHRLLTRANRTKKPVSHASANPTNSTIPHPSATPNYCNSTTA